MTIDRNNPGDEVLIQISAEEFAALGSNAVGYIKRMTSSEFQESFSDVEDLPLEGDIFAVFRGDGTPIALTNNSQAAVENMQQNNLMAVALH